MDKHELIQALQELDAELNSACDIVLIGGAAMILHFGAHRATRDVDMLVLRGNVKALRQAITSVAGKHHLPDDWMNDAAKGFADILPPNFHQRLTPLFEHPQHLRVFVLGRAEQTAMKIVALREQDLEDLELLLPLMSEADRATLVTIMQYVSTFRPDWAQRIRYFLEEQGWTL